MADKTDGPGAGKSESPFVASDRLGDAPIEDRHLQQMNVVAGALDELFNDKAKAPHKEVGFVLMVFPYGDRSGRCNYISNGADRRDVVNLMKEMITRFERQIEVPVSKRRPGK